MAGDSVEVMPDEIARVGGPPRWVRAVVEDVGETSFLADVEGTPFVRGFEEEGTAWRWPEAGAVQAAGEGLACGACGHPAGKHRADETFCDAADCLCDLTPAEVASGAGSFDADAPAGEVPPEPSCRKCGARFAAEAHRAPSPDCDTTLCLRCCGAQPEGEVPPVRFDARLCVYCGQLVAAGGGWEQPGGNLAHVACDRDAQERADAPAGEVSERLLNQGNAGRVEWRLSSRAGVYTGRVLLSGGVAATFTGADSESVMQSMLAKVDSMLDPRDTRVPYVPPAVTRVNERREEVAALLGLHQVQTGLDRRIGDLSHGLQRMRRVVVDAVFEWYERQRAEWAAAPALRDMDADAKEACRQLHERQLVELFAKIGGVL